MKINIKEILKVVCMTVSVLYMGYIGLFTIQTRQDINQLRDCVLQLQYFEIERQLMNPSVPTDTLDYWDHSLLIYNDTVIGTTLFLADDSPQWRSPISIDRRYYD